MTLFNNQLGHTPIFRVERGNSDITSTIADRLISIKVEFYYGGGEADRLTLVVDDRDWNIDIPSVGEDASTLAFYLGYEQSNLVYMGTFKVDRVILSFTPKSMTLICSSSGTNSNLKAPMITSFDDKTIGSIVGSIASAAGVAALVAPALENTTIEYLNQHGGSGQLLQDLEARFDAVAKFGDGKLAFLQRGTRQSASGQTLDAITLDGTDLSDLSIDINNRHSYSKVRASYWDKTQHKLVFLDSSMRGDKASTIPFLIKRAYNTQDEAQDAADSQMNALRRQGCTGTLTMSKGDPRAMAGTPLTLTGMRDGIDGVYTAETVIHSLTKESGLLTTISFYSEDGAGGSE